LDIGELSKIIKLSNIQIYPTIINKNINYYELNNV